MNDYSLKDYCQLEILQSEKYSLIRLLWARYFDPSADALYLIRKFLVRQQKKNIFFKVNQKRIQKRLMKQYGIVIGSEARIGLGLKLIHPNGIIIGRHTIIGKNVTLYQQVTIGSAHDGDHIAGRHPIIKDDCVFYAGSKVLGDILIEDGVKVGANAVLLSNAEKNGVYVGMPAKIIGKQLFKVD